MTSNSLGNRVAVVTGASRGIGEAIARELARRGATVVVSSRKQDALDAVAASIRKDGGSAIPIACHTGTPSQLESLFDKIDTECGRVDVLVNNAATNPFWGEAIDVPESAFDKTVDVNLKGYFVASQLAARRMRETGGGAIVNTASILGISPHPMQVVYSMTKAAVISMTRGMAKELGPHGIRVNAIAPGLIETQLAAKLIETPELHQQFISATPLRRHGQPQDIAAAAAYLASDEASFVTGTVLVCDGGFMA